MNPQTAPHEKPQREQPEQAPERGNAEPLHSLVTRTIAGWIEDGRLSPGNMLPPEVELAQQFGVSRFTVRAGIDALVRMGRLERFRGKGTFVTRPRIQQSLARFYSVAQEMSARGARLDTAPLERGRLFPDHMLADHATDQLGLADPRAIGYLQRLRSVDGVPLLLEWITFPVDVCPGLLREPLPGEPDLGAAPFYDILATRCGITVSTARETLHPVTVAGREARLLQVPARTPVFLVERLTFSDERPIEWRRALVRGDRYNYVVDLKNPQEDVGIQ